ncbi:MAG: hydrolase [Clostridiales bacterium]|nr:hydrolase [Clostridiales bacterium]
MRIKAEDALALIIDLQERLVPAISGSAELIKNTAKLIRGLGILDVPMLVTQQYTKGLGMTVEEIVKAFGEDFSYYDKISFSCAMNEPINQAIAESGRKNIIICGVEAHVCVLQTVIDLIDQGYRVVLVEDCIGSRKEHDKLSAIKRAGLEGAIPATCESLLFELTQVAGTDKFKKISSLVKE